MNVYWFEQTEFEVAARGDWLSAAEAARLSAMRFSKRRADWRLGRWTAKRAVTMHLGLEPRSGVYKSIELYAAADGAPEVFLEGRPARLTISLTHRGSAAACAIAQPGAALGCDLEIIEPRSEGFLADFFTMEEQQAVQRAGAGRDRIAALVWSAKESALKAMRAGLRLDTRSVIVHLFGGETKAPISRQWLPFAVRYVGGGIAEGWWQEEGCLVRTVLAEPPANPPTPLQPETAEAHKAECQQPCFYVGI